MTDTPERPWRTFEIYVDDRYIESIYTRWTLRRLMAQLTRKYLDSGDAQSVEAWENPYPEERRP